ncbi:MAG: transcription repressor NadR [Eubacterium sp.]|nr:transcription repressor NadR [Eubacterium sp.]
MGKLKTEERRNRILELLESSAEPLSGSSIAKAFHVSRQVVVTDIAILRSRYPNLMATSRGYIMLHADKCRRLFKVKHTDAETKDELLSIVELGGRIMDIYVDHRIYGTIRKPLDISSKRDVDHFMKDLESGVSTPLKNITNGYHFHTVEARSESILDEIEDMLENKGYLIESLDAAVIYEPKSYSQG